MVTDDAVPEEQRLVVGGVVKDWELEEPQEPEIGTGVGSGVGVGCGGGVGVGGGTGVGCSLQ